jgi:glycosyltransferase involved in cell wall biosynthesis
VPPPELSVVVPSHFRPLRLRWLLNALWEQTLDRARWEVIVGHDSGPETEQLLREHPLAAAGVLRQAAAPAGTGTPASNRNRALALARAPMVVFTDDDCRPPAVWLQRVLEAAARHPGAVIQGPVQADPAEAAMLRSPYPRTQHFEDVPRVWGECANIAYSRRLLQELGGFYAAGWVTGEDTDLILRARAAGAAYVGDAAMATRHAIEEGTLLDWVRGARRWRDLPDLIARHPRLRDELFLGVFWKESHAWALAAVGGIALATRRPLAAALVIPFARSRPWRGGGPRGRLRHLAELPGWLLIDLAELAVLGAVSARRRVVVL